MKQTIVLLLVLAAAACNPIPKKKEVQERMDGVIAKTEMRFPKTLQKVFDAHGGLETWKTQRTLIYSIPKKGFNEMHTIDLLSRKDRVATEKFAMGFDGNKAWLLDTDKKYKGDAGFYHNLMFYFYAMPFVLADEGIIYSHTEDLVYGGQQYPGIRISYESGVGTSSKDEYFIHFDPQTHKMTWLGYTVTYRTGEISETVKWIRYDDWQAIEGLLLPKSITWHNFEGRKILDARNTVEFEDVILSTESKPNTFYSKPEQGIFVEMKKN